MNAELDKLIQILERAGDKIEVLAERVAAESSLEPDFRHALGKTPEARAGQKIDRLRFAARHVSDAVQLLRDARA